MQNSTKSSVPLFILLLLFFITNAVQAQSAVDRIYTDWRGYWTANAATGSDNRPDSENNLTAFQWNGKTYSTGVNDSRLITEKVIFDAHKFRALKIQDIKRGNSTFFLQGAMIDGTKSASILTPTLTGAVATSAEMVARLTDGINGLALGTGIANIGTSSVSFKIGTDNLNLNGLNDGIPDLIVTQVAQPGGADVFKFVDALGKTVGDPVTIAFQGVKVVGSYSLDIFDSTNGKPANGFISNEVRDIRILAYDLSAFGITAALAPTVDRFVVTFSGSSDCAFIAFNANSLKLAQLDLVKKASLVGCGKLGDKITYDFEVTNTGDVPLRNITVLDPKLGTTAVGTISTLNVGAKVTFTANYTITAADVALGYVSNSAKVTAIDPSDNLVEDVSGQTINDDIATTTVLFQPPTIDSIIDATCTRKGSITLNNLPTSGTWTLMQTGGISKEYSGTSTTFIVPDLDAGNYEFAVFSSGGCQSPKSLPIMVKGPITNSWNGSEWSAKKLPTIDEKIVFAGNAIVKVNISGCNCVVNSGVSVRFSSNTTLKLQDKLTTNGSLLFEDGASLVQLNNVENSGKIIYNRTTKPMRNFDYTYWSSPVANQTTVGLSPYTLSDKYHAWFNNDWILHTGIMEAGYGYIIRVPKPGIAVPDWTGSTYEQQVTFRGVPNNGTIIGETAVAGQDYLIGNPYPSAVNADKFLSANPFLAGTIYFWTHNTSISSNGSGQYTYDSSDFAAYNGVGGIATRAALNSGLNSSIPNGNIAAGQSFFANATTNGTITFTNGMRVEGQNSQFFKPNATIKKDRIWLNLANKDGAFKQILIGYVTDATNGYDSKFDGITFDGNDFCDFYSINTNSNFVIQGRALPFVDTDEIPLGYSSIIAGDFTIAIDQTDGDLSIQDVFIVDNLTNATFNLRKGGYTFTTAKGRFNDRFVLKYTNKTLGVDDLQQQNKTIKVSVKNKVITIDATTHTIEKVLIYDVSGKTIYSKSKINSSVFEIANLRSSDQVLLVKLQLENGITQTTKIIF